MKRFLPLIAIESRLLVRDWNVLVFAFVFPPFVMLILAGVFGTQPSGGFGNRRPDDYYVAASIGVPVIALGLVGLPVALSSRRTPWSVATHVEPPPTATPNGRPYGVWTYRSECVAVSSLATASKFGSVTQTAPSPKASHHASISEDDEGNGGLSGNAAPTAPVAGSTSRIRAGLRLRTQSASSP